MLSTSAVEAIVSHLIRRPDLGGDATAILAVTAFAGAAVAAAFFFYNSSGHLKSPWSRRKRKHILTPQQWRALFSPDGQLRDNGVKFLKIVRSGGVDPSIRAEVWPFLLGVYHLTSSREERENVRTRRRHEYEKLRRRCRKLVEQNNELHRLTENDETTGEGENNTEGMKSPDSEHIVGARESMSSGGFSCKEGADEPVHISEDATDCSERVPDPNLSTGSESSDSDSSDDPETSQTFTFTESTDEYNYDLSPSGEAQSKSRGSEGFLTWQRIILLDAIRANEEWMNYAPAQANVPEDKARASAEAVGLKDYDHLHPGRIFHAARLVAILEAYAVYDPEIGYCQGMCDLLSPIIAVMAEDDEAFWCFVGFMKKARHNFRLDEVGIRRQLGTVSKIIKYKDSNLYRHLEKLEAEDCFFVYRMVVVLFRRELTFEQTLCLWEVMWADQAAIRAGIGKSAWSRIRLGAPPTEDLLLYAIAASVLQRRKQIIERYYSMDEILRECNAMAGHLDVWKLLDDAHGLVVTLHDKIEEAPL